MLFSGSDFIFDHQSDTLMTPLYSLVVERHRTVESGRGMRYLDGGGLVELNGQKGLSLWERLAYDHPSRSPKDETNQKVNRQAWDRKLYF